MLHNIVFTFMLHHTQIARATRCLRSTVQFDKRRYIFSSFFR